MTTRIFVLQTQYDIIDFRLGHRPANFLVRDFESKAAMEAYCSGIESLGDEYGRIEDIKVLASKVVYTCRSEDPDADVVVDTTEAEFGTPSEAEAYCQGIRDAEGFAAPLVIDDTDDRFEQLLAWSADSGH